MFAQPSVPLGYEQITGLSAAKGLTVPAGATFAIITADTQDVRYRDDGAAPTASIGMPLVKGAIFQYSGTLSKIKFIEQSASAVLNVSYYR
ncbi:MAG: hypothetical protein V4458_13200 [Pseudomonadota bacterium]